MDSIKVAILEQAGVELGGVVEYDLQASSVPFSRSGYTSTNVSDAIDESKQQAITISRFEKACYMNGVMGNGTYIVGNELLPNRETFFAVFSGIIDEISFSFDNASVSFDCEIYKNGKAAGNLIKTLNIVNQTSRVYFVSQNISFVAGDYFYFKYIDQGTNASDMQTELWGRRIS